MNKGFTIIELLVASLLLGIIVTILTMIFNQSSIAWRIGSEGVLDMDQIRKNIAVLRDEADHAFLRGDTVYRLSNLWDKNGVLRPRACNASGASDDLQIQWVKNAQEVRSGRALVVNVSSANGSSNVRTYTVNVKSAGPDRTFNTYDDIWSFPDDPSEW